MEVEIHRMLSTANTLSYFARVVDEDGCRCTESGHGYEAKEALTNLETIVLGDIERAEGMHRRLEEPLEAVREKQAALAKEAAK